MTLTIIEVAERFDFGWYLTDDGSVLFDSQIHEPFYPITYENDIPIYTPLRKRLLDHGRPTRICARCGEPSWHLTRHAIERHGDRDVQFLPALPGNHRPDWFHPEWI